MTLFTSGITPWGFSGVTGFVFLPIHPDSLLGTKGIPVEASHPDEHSAWPWESDSLKVGS